MFEDKLVQYMISGVACFYVAQTQIKIQRAFDRNTQIPFTKLIWVQIQFTNQN